MTTPDEIRAAAVELREGLRSVDRYLAGGDPEAKGTWNETEKEEVPPDAFCADCGARLDPEEACPACRLISAGDTVQTSLGEGTAIPAEEAAQTLDLSWRYCSVCDDEISPDYQGVHPRCAPHETPEQRALRLKTVQGRSKPSRNAQGGFQEPEVVDHPSHYQTESGLESIDVIEAFQLSFHLGNAIKYILRAGKKPGQSKHRDLEKALWYIKREIGRE